MIFEVDDEELSIDIYIEDEAVDLTRDGLGDKCLDAAVEGMIEACQAKRDPATGKPWAQLASRTIERKGHPDIGVETGLMLDPARFRPGDRDITPDRATWRYDGPDYAGYFHRGSEVVRGRRVRQPARPIVGWSAEAKDQIRRLIEEAVG